VISHYVYDSNELNKQSREKAYNTPNQVYITTIAVILKIMRLKFI